MTVAFDAVASDSVSASSGTTVGGSQAVRWGELHDNSGADLAAGLTLSASGSSTTMAWTYANSGATIAWAAAAASFQVGSGGGGGSALASIATARKIFLKPKTPWPPRRLSLSWPLRWIAKPSKTLQRKPSAPIAACRRL